ncbi:MAG: glycosyltransferase [Alphaproteobacteria bacterium]|nr:glycosyltransferase [Alphaproteobacteria bacterium]
MKPAINPNFAAQSPAMSQNTILNVLHLSHLAGTERMFLQYTNMLADAGYRVVCIVPPGAQVINELRKKNAIVVIEDKAVHVNRGKFNPLQVHKYRKLLRDYQVSLVMTHSGGLTRLFRRVCGKACPLVAVNHNTNPKQSALADYAIATNRYIWEQITGRGMEEDRVKLLFNSTDVPQQSVTITPYHSPPVIGSLGRMDNNKRVDTLLHALALLRDEGVDFNAILGGDGPCREELETLSNTLNLQEHVRFYGWVSDKDDFFSQIDIFAFCSMCESFPLVMLEAIQYGKPVISSDFAGVGDMVINDHTGATFTRGDANEMAGALKRFIADAPHAHGLSRTAFDCTKKHFSTEAAGLELAEFVRGILK